MNERNYCHIGREIDPSTMEWVYALRTNIGETLTGNPHGLYLRFATKTIAHGTHWIAVDPALGATAPVGAPLARSLDTEVYNWQYAREQDSDWREFLSDVLVTAMEGGINYWCGTEQYTHDDPHPFARIVETEDDGDISQNCSGFKVPQDTPCKGHEITLETIEKGIAFCRMVSPDNYKSHHIEQCVNEKDASMIDACGADIIVQFGLFGDIVYG